MSVGIKVVAVSIHLIRRVDSRPELLLMRRADTMKGIWMNVAGRIEEDETAWQTALRETREETGLVPHTLYNAEELEQFYTVPNDRINVLPVFVGFVADDAQVVLNDEHDAFEWVSFDDAIERVEYGGQRRVIRHVRDEFINRKPSPWLKIEI